MYLCLKSKRLMLPQESMVCSSLPFLFLIEQMDRHNLADLTKDDVPHSLKRDKRKEKKEKIKAKPRNVENIDLHVQPLVPLRVCRANL